MKPFVIIVAVAICLYRLTIKPGLNLADAYKDGSHLYVGGMWACYFLIRTVQTKIDRVWSDLGSNGYDMRTLNQFGGTLTAWTLKIRSGFFWIATLMTAHEVFCAVLGKHAGMSITCLLRSFFS